MLYARAPTHNSATFGNGSINAASEHQDFWIVNAIRARVTSANIVDLQSRSDIARIDPNPSVARTLPEPAAAQTKLVATSDIGWGVQQINAPDMWLAGFTGQNVVIGGEDTGYQWNHPILKPHYRGWNGTRVDHNYNWHDAIHNAQVGNPCGSNAVAPCDDDEHGTHTAGTFVGDDGANASPRHQYGVAPGAKWIGCRNMDEGNGTPARYIECMQFMLAPTDSAGKNPNPDLAADIVSNSWSCPTSEGCAGGHARGGSRRFSRWRNFFRRGCAKLWDRHARRSLIRQHFTMPVSSSARAIKPIAWHRFRRWVPLPDRARSDPTSSRLACRFARVFRPTRTTVRSAERAWRHRTSPAPRRC